MLFGFSVYEVEGLPYRMTPLPPDVKPDPPPARKRFEFDDSSHPLNLTLKSLHFGKPAQPHLVPVRKGGPHARFVTKDGWSLWRGGKHDQWQQHGDGSLAPTFCITDGCWQYWSPSSETWSPTKSNDHVRDGDELRAPLGWTGDLPEGTRLATDFVVGQRLRHLNKGWHGLVTKVDRYVHVQWIEHEGLWGYDKTESRLKGY